MGGRNKIYKKNKPRPVKNIEHTTLKKDFDQQNFTNTKFNINYLIYGIIFLFTFTIYFNTIFNKYALDDAIVITQNDYTQKGLSGIKDIFTTELFTGFFKVKKDLVAGGRYRPLSMVTFAIEYEFIPESIRPNISHLVNIILFALNNILIYIILSKLLVKYTYKKWYLSLPFIATILYVAHPIHTEVVACIKGRDDILAFGGALLSIYFTIKYLQNNKVKYLIYSFITFFLALLSKESAVPFLAIIPITIYFFTKYSSKQNFITILPLLSALFLFFIIRQKVLGSQVTKIPNELMNDSFLHATFSEKYATIIYTLGFYIKLLFVPHPLTYDYYPYHIHLINWGSFKAIVSLLIYLFLAVYALTGIKKKNIISYCIIFYFAIISIVSNVFFPIGTFMSERFLYSASLPFCIVIAYFLVVKVPLLIKNSKLYNILISSFLLIVLSLYSTKTISRNMAWKNDFTLFTTDVLTSFDSAKSNTSAGGKLMEEAVKPENKAKKDKYLKLSLNYLNRAVKIHPTYVDALLLLGNAYYEYRKNYDSTIYYYKKVLDKNPTYNLIYTNIEKIFVFNNDIDFKFKVYKELYNYNPNRFEVNYNLGSIYGKYKNDIQNSIFYLDRAVQINPQSKEANKDLGVAYGIKGEFDKSIKYFENASKIDPNDAEIFMNLGVTYKRMNNETKANEYFIIASKLNPKAK